MTIPLILPRSDYLQPLLVPGGRFYDQIEEAYKAINQCDELSCVKAQAAMYLYIKIKKPIENDEKFILKLLETERVQVVQGTGFDDHNLPRHFRIVCLAPVAELQEGISRLIRFVQNYR